MRRYPFVLTTALLLGASSAVGCGDDRVVAGVAPPEAGSPDAARADPFAALDGGRSSCATRWRDLQLGTELDDQVLGMAIDADDNVYVSGFEHGLTGVTNIEPDGDSRGVVLSLDPTGTIRWKAVLDTAGTDTVEDVTVDPATRKAYAVGRTSGAFAGFVNRGQFDTFLVSLDAAGRITRVDQSGDERPQHPTRLGLGANQDLAVSGFDDTYIPTNANYVESWEHGFVASFDRGDPTDVKFTQSFLQKVPLPNPSRVTGVVVDRDGSLYLTRNVSGARVNGGVFVERLNRDGTVAWSQRITTSAADVANAVALSPSNELFVAGATVLSLRGRNAGQQDAFVLKVDKSTGDVIWVAQAGSAASDYPTALAFDTAGNVYIAGDTLGNVVDGAPNRGGIDAFAMKLDSAGKLLSTWQAGTAEDDFAAGLVVDRCSNVLVGGYTRGALVQGGQGNAGGYDMFVVRAAL